MLQMHSNTDGPTIEEIVDNHLSDEQIAQEEAFKREFQLVREEMTQMTRGGANNDSQQLEKVVNSLTRWIEKWEDDEDYGTKIKLRQDSIIKFRVRKDEYQRKIDRAEEEFFKRRQREQEESVMRENPRRYSTYREDEITRRSDRTGLNHNSYEGSSTRHRTQAYDSDDDYENRPISSYDRYRPSSKKSNQSTMYQQRRDESNSLHRSNFTMNGTSNSQQERMRSGKSRVTKTSRKYRPGQKALSEIRQYQKSTDLLIQKAPFARLVHEIIREETNKDYRIRADAIHALQEAAEAFMVEMFEGSTLISNHAKRVTLMPTDIQLYRRLCLRNL